MLSGLDFEDSEQSTVHAYSEAAGSDDDEEAAGSDDDEEVDLALELSRLGSQREPRLRGARARGRRGAAPRPAAVRGGGAPGAAEGEAAAPVEKSRVTLVRVASNR